MPQTNSILVQTSPLDEPAGATAFDVLQPEVISPKVKHVCRAIFENSNGKCILLSVSIYGFLVLTIWCQIAPAVNEEEVHIHRQISEMENKCQTYLLVPIIFATLFYVSYLLENWQYYTKQEDLITISIPSTMSWINKMKSSLPMVWWKASSYHYTVFPCRHGPSSGLNRPSSTSNSTYQRIISHTGVGRYNYLTHGFRDVSSVIHGLDKSALTRIHFGKSFVFFTSTAAKEFEEQRKSFFRDYQQHDDYVEMREGMDLMDIDFPDEVIVVRDLDRVPWWRRKSTFILSVLCLQAAPLRVLLALQTATLHYNVLKVFGMDERESNWEGTVSRESFQENLLPPSYSEIMLQQSTSEATSHRPRSFGKTLLRKTGTFVKSATFGFTGSSVNSKEETKESFELSAGVKARGVILEGHNPVSPTEELRNVHDVSAVLRRNGPKMFNGAKMRKSNTAPVITMVIESNTDPGTVGHRMF